MLLNLFIVSCRAQPSSLQPGHHLQQPLWQALPCIARLDVPVPREEAPQAVGVQGRRLRQLLDARRAQAEHLARPLKKVQEACRQGRFTWISME